MAEDKRAGSSRNLVSLSFTKDALGFLFYERTVVLAAMGGAALIRGLFLVQMKTKNCIVICGFGVQVESWISSACKRPKKPEFTGSGILSVWSIPTVPHDIEEMFFLKGDSKLHVGLPRIELRSHPPQGCILPLYYSPNTTLIKLRNIRI